MNGEKKRVWVGFGVLLYRDGKILLWKRHDDPEKADSELHGEGSWTMPGGKLEFWESLEEGGAREVMEETWIKLNDVEIICVNNDKNEFAHFITIGMYSDDFEGEAQVMEPDEITKWEWFSIDNLPSPMFPPSVKVLENYKRNAFYIK